MEILPLAKETQCDSSQVGGKGAGLIHLIQLGMAVPSGIIITTSAYAAQAQKCGLEETLIPFIEGEDWEGAEKASRKIFYSCAFSQELEGEILERYRRMNGPRVAVRSSATCEDLADASFAGQYETFLNVEGEKDLIQAVAKCWASLWNRRALAYRKQRAIDHFSARMAVVVQEMVPADSAGVVFTIDPLRPNDNRMIIEIAQGLGESIVSGAVCGEIYRVNRKDLSRETGNGAQGTLLDHGLSKTLCQMALRVEEHFGTAQDIEFAISEGKIYLLQARPMTSFSHSSPEELDPPGKPSLIDKMIKPFVDERYSVAPRPLDNIVFIRLLGGHIFAVKECGAQIKPEDEARFQAQIWRQAYRLPPIQKLTKAMLYSMYHSFLQLSTDWMSWWASGPRDAVLAVSQPMELLSLSNEELFERAEKILSVWEGPLYQRLSASSGIRAEGFLKLIVSAAVGFRKSEEIMASLMTGFKNPTIDLNEELWQLSRLARSNPEVMTAVRDMAPERLESSTVGREFLKAFDIFMGNYGHREGSCWYLTTPTWRQDPKQVWRLLSSLVESEKRAGNPKEIYARRQAALALVEGRLRFMPGLLRAFRWMLQRLSRLNEFREVTHFDLTRPLAALQEIAAEWGRRLTRLGVLEREEDVGYLKYEEVKEWLCGSPPPVEDARRLIARRRATYRVVNGSWQAERFGGLVLNGKLKGIGASPGIIRGKVRIIRGEHEFNRLHADEILVSPYTNPAWTPLFATAAAVVTETGGVSSHAAIVAREYGIPAVMAVRGATRVLKDGQEILVDGTRGIVHG